MTILKKKSKIFIISIGDNARIDDLFNKMKKSNDCRYMTYMLERGHEKFYFSSNEKWREMLTNEKLMNHCPIYRNAFNALRESNYIFTAWDFVSHKRGIEKEINDERTSLDIAHGLGVAINYENTRESLVFAGQKSDHLFYERVSNKKTINDSLAVFRREINDLSKKII